MNDVAIDFAAIGRTGDAAEDQGPFDDTVCRPPVERTDPRYVLAVRSTGDGTSNEILKEQQDLSFS